MRFVHIQMKPVIVFIAVRNDPESVVNNSDAMISANPVPSYLPVNFLTPKNYPSSLERNGCPNETGRNSVETFTRRVFAASDDENHTLKVRSLPSSSI